MEKIKRALCYCCGRHRYTKYMINTPLANANNQWSFVCKDKKCLIELEKQLTQFIKLNTKKIKESEQILSSLEAEKKKNFKQLEII
jgi:hypothetical protein